MVLGNFYLLIEKSTILYLDSHSGLQILNFQLYNVKESEVLSYAYGREAHLQTL